MRLYFDKSYETLIRPWAIDTLVGPSNYFVNGVKFYPETYPENDVFNGFPNWLHFGFSDHSRMDYCVNLVECARSAPMDAPAWEHKKTKEHLRENMDFEAQIIKLGSKKIV